MEPIQHAPAFNVKDAIKLVLELYGLKGYAKVLPSERDQNFLFESDSGDRYVFKIANALEDRNLLEAQNRAMAHLAKQTSFCQQVVLTQSGDDISEVYSQGGVKYFVRLLSYLPGIPFGESKRHSNSLLNSLGRYLGQIDRAFTDFDHPAVHRDFYWDLANALKIVHQYCSLIKEEELRQSINQFVKFFENQIVPLFPKLRKSVIHNDANDYNIIIGGGDNLHTRNQQIIGLIDFGDMVYSYTVCELAVAIAYAILDKPDPLGTASKVVRGYHAEHPLQEEEIASLFGFVCMRLCMSACIAAHQKQHRPEDKYLTLSQQPIQNTLPKLAKIHPRFALATFRLSCGLTPNQSTESIYSWLQKKTDTIAPVLGLNLESESCIVFDLGIGSPLVDVNNKGNAENTLTRRLFKKMQESKARVGIGQYNESRLLYTPPLGNNDDFSASDNRTIHIGMDIIAEPDTPVYAPLSGTIYLSENNTQQTGDGPVIILHHQTDDGETFYTLYRYLSQTSLDKLKKGQKIAQGEQIGSVESHEVMVGWAPRLHFQLITDLLDLDSNFPGVCKSNECAVWIAFSPDPNVILKVPDHLFPKPKTDKSKTLTARRRYTGRNLSIEYKDPLKIERGWMQYLYDETGRKFLDAYNNVPHVGHCHPRIIEAAHQQMKVLNTNTRYLHDFFNNYAERLCATMPDPLKICFFVNSASEGNELALRLARAHTKQRDMIVLESAYHGNTNTLIDISPYKHDGPGGTGAPSWVHTAPVADVYRGRYKADDPDAANKYAQHILQIIEDLRKKGRGLCGFIAESYPSVRGQIIFPEDYLAQVYQHVHRAGGIFIADEVQTGYGRVGTHFYAFEAQGVVPDIVVLGKPIGNGHPIGAVVTTPEIAASFHTGMEFFSTFGGNTVSCAVGLAVLNTVLEENLQAHALEVGDHLLEGLNRFKGSYPIVGDVRGSGLFIGVELVRDHETLEPAGQEASFIADRMREYGVLLGTDGPYHNVIKIRPPMPFSKGDADVLIDTMEKILEEDFSRNPEKGL